MALLFGAGALTPADKSALMEAVHVAEEEMADSLFKCCRERPGAVSRSGGNCVKAVQSSGRWWIACAIVHVREPCCRR